MFVGLFLVVLAAICLSAWCCRGTFFTLSGSCRRLTLYISAGSFENPLCCPCYLCACCGGLGMSKVYSRPSTSTHPSFSVSGVYRMWALRRRLGQRLIVVACERRTLPQCRNFTTSDCFSRTFTDIKDLLGLSLSSYVYFLTIPRSVSFCLAIPHRLSARFKTFRVNAS